jgi:ribulose-phosphate 3-epimerase
MKLKHNAHALIEIDGGVDLANYKKLIECGANVLVAGNTVFGSSDPVQTIQQLKKS